MCPNQCAQNENATTVQRTLVVAFSAKGDGLSGGRLQALSYRAFPCKSLGRVYLQVRGEVAERLKAAVC